MQYEPATHQNREPHYVYYIKETLALVTNLERSLVLS